MNLFNFLQLENDKSKIQPKLDCVPMKYKLLPFFLFLNLFFSFFNFFLF